MPHTTAADEMLAQYSQHSPQRNSSATRLGVVGSGLGLGPTNPALSPRAQRGTLRPFPLSAQGQAKLPGQADPTTPRLDMLQGSQVGQSLLSRSSSSDCGSPMSHELQAAEDAEFELLYDMSRARGAIARPNTPDGWRPAFINLTLTPVSDCNWWHNPRLHTNSLNPTSAPTQNKNQLVVAQANENNKVQEILGRSPAGAAVAAAAAAQRVKAAGRLRRGIAGYVDGAQRWTNVGFHLGSSTQVSDAGHFS